MLRKATETTAHVAGFGIIPIVAPDIEINSYLLWDDQRYLTHAVRTFRDYLVSEAGTLPGNNFAAP